MKEACAAAGHPERAYSIIQITGTNGKTSTSRIIEQLLIAEGVKTALYTSPSLICETERIRVNGADISKEQLATARASAVEAAASIGLKLTDFEEMTLAMFIHLRETKVDIAVIEVGMGGRWDATSAADPAVAVITALGLDHQEFLGETVEEIGFDKSHIIKPGSSVILGESIFHHPPHIADIFLDRAHSFGLHPRCVSSESFTVNSSSPLKTNFEVTTPHAHYKDLTIAGPAYQASNAATALFAAEAALGRALDTGATQKAIARTTFPGRFEVVLKDKNTGKPKLIFDGSHNPAAIQILAELIAEMTAETGEKPIIALGILKDKDAEGMIKALAPVTTDFIAIEPPNPRAIPVSELASLIERLTDTTPLATFPQRTAMDALLNITGKQPVIVTGSLSLYPLLQSIRLCAVDPCPESRVEDTES